MKICVIVSRFPYPLEKGDKLRAYHQIRELSKKHELYLIALSDQKIQNNWKIELEKYCKEVTVFRLKKWQIYWNTFLQFFTEKPFQIGYFYSKKIHRKCNEKIKRIQPDHIYCQLIRTAEYVKNFQAIPKTLDYMDALSKGMLRRAEISSGILKTFYRNEGRRLSAYENRIFDYFDHHTIISEQDKNFIQHNSRNKIVVIENGISEEFLDYSCDENKEYDIVFTGNMNYAPNIECAEFLSNKIIPELIQRGIKIKLLLSGASPSKRILQLASENVTISGWVDDIRTSYCKAKIFVAPLFIGTGLQNKLLEAMALGLPCITTSLANNALGAKANESILIAETTKEFADAVENLLTDELLRKQIIANGKVYVSQSFSWSKSVEKLDAIFESKQNR